MVEGVSQRGICGGSGVAFKGMLNGDLPPIVLAQEGTHNRSRLRSQCVSGDVVGDSEQDKRVQAYLHIGGLVAAEQRIGRRGSHFWCVVGLSGRPIALAEGVPSWEEWYREYGRWVAEYGRRQELREKESEVPYTHGAEA